MQEVLLDIGKIIRSVDWVRSFHGVRIPVVRLHLFDNNHSSTTSTTSISSDYNQSWTWSQSLCTACKIHNSVRYGNYSNDSTSTRDLQLQSTRDLQLQTNLLEEPTIWNYVIQVNWTNSNKEAYSK